MSKLDIELQASDILNAYALCFQALADPYFYGLANVDREPTTQPISKLEFEFERRKLAKDDVRELIYREILEYHPKMLQEYLRGGEQTSFLYPSGVDRFKRQFAHLEEHYGKGERSTPLQRQHASLPRGYYCTLGWVENTSVFLLDRPCYLFLSERVPAPKEEKVAENNDTVSKSRFSDGSEKTDAEGENGLSKPNSSARSLLKSASISASKCVIVKEKNESMEQTIAEADDEIVDVLSQKVAAINA
ncbi:Mitogen-activated protein kinase 9 [Gossypium australe]|uniref:Mitogen-activated protein kinase 9 n=1 Tax=Gossypium australe TaxID=47621 RepID=A0A5B6UZ76_9ROSI|nr:Mitogen-activated protein kinase 9 [Gossypium australe]